MNELDRFRQLTFNGLQSFDGKSEALGLFTDPVTKTTFCVKIGEQLGERMDEVKRIWGE